MQRIIMPWLILIILTACTGNPPITLPEANHGKQTLQNRQRQAVQAIMVTYHHFQTYYLKEIDSRLLYESALQGVVTAYPGLAERLPVVLTAALPALTDDETFTRAIVLGIGKLINMPYQGEDRSGYYIAAVRGMVSLLGKETRYYTPEEALIYLQPPQQASVGIYFNHPDYTEEALIMEVIQKSPAKRAGLLPGDSIVRVDDTLVSEMSTADLYRALRGEGSSVARLYLKRKGFRGIIRKDVIRSSEYKHYRIIYRHLSPITLYVRYRIIVKDGEKTLLNIIDRHRNRYGKESLQRLVIDLRSNRGGVLTNVLPMMDLFVANQRLLLVDGRHPDYQRIYQSDDKVSIPDIPIVVLVDAGTGGAAEVWAQFLREQRGAIIFGRETSHYGNIRAMVKLPNDGLLLYPAGTMLLASGWKVNDKGVKLDICSKPITAGCAQGSDLPLNNKPDRSIEMAQHLLGREAGKRAGNAKRR